ncbi:hypothetical protein ACQCVB_19430 [Fictibacillus phosphorivorans]|uniref:hypothetical protein n=1 Tax=Fictibacillus phosphorivorans TaxID=1221500 RepID=UPI003CF1D7E0
MIYVIRPSGGRLKNWLSWLYQSLLYTFAAVLSSGFTGFIAATIGKTLNFDVLDWSLLIVGIISLLYGFKEVGLIKLPMPQRKWQVPISWIINRKYTGAFFYGITIGAGYLTYITYSGFYVWVLLSMVLGNPVYGLLVGAIYGLGRSLPLIFGGLSLYLKESNVATFSQIVFLRAKMWKIVSSFLLISGGFVLLLL